MGSHLAISNDCQQTATCRSDPACGGVAIACSPGHLQVRPICHCLVVHRGLQGEKTGLLKACVDTVISLLRCSQGTDRL